MSEEKPTLEDDWAAVRELVPFEGMRRGRIGEALARIEAALADRAHLEEGARILAASHELGLVRNTAYGAALTRWLEAERTRKANR